MRFLVSFLLMFGFVSKSFAEDCHCEQRAKDNSCVRGYCVHEGESDTVLYYLHGSGGSLETWERSNYYPAQLRSYWKDNKLKTPTVVTISYGPQWLLSSKNYSPVSGLFDDFEMRLRPQIEARLPHKIKKRMLLGESMGGFNSLQLALRTTHYSKAAALCAVVGDDLTPFSRIDDIQRVIRRSKAYQYHGEENFELILDHVKGAFTLARAFFPLPAVWQQFDPLNLVRETQSPAKFYIATGFHDMYLNYEGNEELVRRMRQEGIKVDWRPQWGGHCAVDVPSLAEFLAE